MALDAAQLQQFVANRAPDDDLTDLGHVKRKVYRVCLKAAGGAVPRIGFLVVLCVGHASWVAQTWSLKELSKHTTAAQTIYQAERGTKFASSLPRPSASAGTKQPWIPGMVTYVAVYVVNSIAQISSRVAMLSPSTEAGRRLLLQMTHAILWASVASVGKMPAGRILGRPTIGQLRLDKNLPNRAFSILSSMPRSIAIISTKYLTHSPDSTIIYTRPGTLY